MPKRMNKAKRGQSHKVKQVRRAGWLHARLDATAEYVRKKIIPRGGGWKAWRIPCYDNRTHPQSFRVQFECRGNRFRTQQEVQNFLRGKTLAVRNFGGENIWR